MTDAYEELMKAFGQQLDTAASRLSRRRRGRRASAASAGCLGLACLLAGVLVLAGERGSSHLDIVEQAEAALLPARSVVYMVTTEHAEISGAPNVQGPAPLPTQQWSAADPLRWRIAVDIPAHGNIKVSDRNGRRVVGLEQFSYGNGTAKYYASQNNALEITTGLSDDGPAATAPTDPLGADPVAQVRSMLDAGQLRDAGTGLVAGKPVRRLTGALQRGPNAQWPVEYDVAPKTFEPVRVVIQMRIASPLTGRAGTEILVENVDEYKRLPLDNSTSELLTIHPTGTPTVFRHRSEASTTRR